VADLAAAYSGLCATSPNLADSFVIANTSGVTVGQLRYNGQRRQGWTDEQILQFEQTYDRVTLLQSHYTVHFYCKQATQLYNRLPPRLKADPQVRFGQAVALDYLGNDFYTIYKTESELEPKQEGNKAESLWRCYITSENVPSPSAQHPYLRFSLKYHQQALKLLPENATLRCNVASDSLELGDRDPMEQLNDIAEAHRELGRSLAESARSESDKEESAALYRKALQELNRAIDRKPYDMDALNEYAYDFWSWRLLHPFSQSTLAPDFDMGQAAEHYARRAANVALRSSSITTIVQVQSTLGEVLLALGRPDEAIQELDKARKTADKGWDQPFYDEVRWDLAQAYLCAQSIDGGGVQFRWVNHALIMDTSCGLRRKTAGSQ